MMPSLAGTGWRTTYRRIPARGNRAPATYYIVPAMSATAPRHGTYYIVPGVSRRLSRRGADRDAGTGMIDVLVASTILSVLVVVIGALLAVAARSELTSSTSSYATVLAADVASQAASDGCGAATGYGTASEASTLATSCTFSPGNTSSLGDIALPGTGQDEAYCPAQAQGVPGPACYPVPGLGTYYTTGLSFSWSWASGAPDLASISDGEKVTGPPPDELITTSVVGWRDKGVYQKTSHMVVSQPPAALSTGWAAGGMGIVLVKVGQSEPVGLVVTGWPVADPGPIVTATCTSGQGCFAVFPYVPAGTYQVWAGQSSNPAQSVTVTGGEWSTVSA